MALTWISPVRNPTHFLCFFFRIVHPVPVVFVLLFLAGQMAFALELFLVLLSCVCRSALYDAVVKSAAQISLPALSRWVSRPRASRAFTATLWAK